jgi:hypothetical protein
MYNVETVESLHSYAHRLHREAPRVATSTMPRRSPLRSVLRKVRRTA